MTDKRARHISRESFLEISSFGCKRLVYDFTHFFESSDYSVFYIICFVMFRMLSGIVPEHDKDIQ